jgi:hypothetical protein
VAVVAVVAVDWVTVWHGSGLNGSVDDGSSGLNDSVAMWQHGSGRVWQNGSVWQSVSAKNYAHIQYI